MLLVGAVAAFKAASKLSGEIGMVTSITTYMLAGGTPVPVLTSAFEDRTLPERPAPVRERPVGEEDAEGGENRNRRRHRGGRRRNGGEASNAGEATRREPPKSAAGQSAEMLCAKDASYIRVLGFDREGRYCLKIMRRNAALPIISNPSDALELYSSSPVLKNMFSLDMRAASLYWEMSGRDFLHEWELPPVML